MGALSQDVKAELAAELEVVASWVEGPRKTKVLAIAHRIQGLEPDEAVKAAEQKIAAQDAPTDLSENPGSHIPEPDES